VDKVAQSDDRKSNQPDGQGENGLPVMEECAFRYALAIQEQQRWDEQQKESVRIEADSGAEHAGKYCAR
jgi:hypothetical protein